MNRPGYNKYIKQMNDEVKEINLDKIVKKHITKNGDGIDSMNGKNALQVDDHEFLGELKYLVGNNVDSYLRENANELLKVLDKNRVESLESQDDILKNKVVQALMSKYKYVVAFKGGSQGGAVFSNATLANNVANDIMSSYGVDKTDLIIKGFTLKVTDAANENDTPGYYESKYGKNIKNEIYYIDGNDIFKEKYGYKWVVELLEKNEIKGLAIKYKNVDDSSMGEFLYLKEKFAGNRDIELKGGYLKFSK